MLVLLARPGFFPVLEEQKKETYLLTLYDSELKFNRELKLAECSLQDANSGWKSGWQAEPKS